MPPQGHHNVHIGFVTIGQMVQKFKCYRQTDRHARTHEQHGDVKSVDFRKLSFPKICHYAVYTAVLSVCVRLLHMYQLTECYNVGQAYILRSSQCHK